MHHFLHLYIPHLMKTRFSMTLVAVLTALPMLASAISIQPADFYNDVRASSPEAAGINLLTRENIVKGYGSRQFGPTRVINRAEFLKIAMLSAQREYYASGRSCFPDVMLYDWFSAYICAARDQDVVQGFGDGKFHPEYTVTYGEALKMLTVLFGYQPQSVSGHWAEKYYVAASKRGVDLPITIDLDAPLTRGQAVRLAAAFFAESKGGLSALRLAEGGVYESSSSSSSVSSSMSSTMSSSSSSSSSFPNRALDPLTDTVVRTQFILLGETSPIIGAAKFFIEEEPLDVTSISVNLLSDIPTVQSLLVYDDDRRYLGRATLNTATSSTNRNYRLEIPVGMFTVGKREDRSVYFRAQLASKDAGGLGNQTVQISNVIVQGNGGWSNRAYTKQSSTSDVFPVFVTSRSTIVSVSNAGQSNAALVTGTNQLIGTFTFVGRKTDSSAKINLTDLVFQIEQTGQVTLSNVKIGTSGFPDRTNCLVSGSLATCANLSESLGSLTDLPRTLAVYGDVTAGDTMHASLRLTLNDAGSSSTDGAVTWTDGTSVFTWVAVDSPVVLGTHYKY